MTALKLSLKWQLLLLGAILTLANLGMVLHRSSRVYLFQQTQCFNYYAVSDPSRIDPNSRVQESLCKLREIQAPLSITDGIDSFLARLPALLVLATYKEFLKVVGLRRLVIINTCCSALGVLYSVASFSFHQQWTTNAILASCILDLVGGGEMTRITMVTICIAKIIPLEKLTNAYNYISGCFLLAAVLGSTIGSLLLSNYVYYLNGLSIMCFVMTACIAIIIPSHLGRESELCGDSATILLTPDDSGSRPSSPAQRGIPAYRRENRSLTSIVLHSWRSSYQSFLTLFGVPDPTFTVLIVFLLNGLAVGINVLLPQYTSLTLQWPLATVNRAMALQALVSALVLFALPTLRRCFLEPRMAAKQIDLFITQSSLFANAIGVIGLGISAPATFFILSFCVYTSGSGLADSLTSYGTSSLPEGQKVDDLYVRTGLISTVAGLVGAPLWSGLFSFVIQSEFLPLGLPFWLCASLYIGGIAGVKALSSSWAQLPEGLLVSPVHNDELDG